jgi:hypothetical protein
MISVVTTIFPPTDSLKKFSEIQTEPNRIIVIGDKKGPDEFELRNCEFYSLESQTQMPFKLAGLLPYGHYSRKNLGYLIAVRLGNDCIYETDDDNCPNQFWGPREKTIRALIAEKSTWINIYNHFTKEKIWPIGFLLDRLVKIDSFPLHNGLLVEFESPLQQGLADVSPDVDAIWRLTQDREFYFERKESIALPAGSWCPFNTQSTWWWREAFPLLYLPSFCSFRMTDIWKSFVAQRCLWEMDYMVVFHAPEVNQQRNYHNLMKDFEAEIPGYTKNELLTQTLENTALLPGKENALRNLVVCYEALISKGLLPSEEMPLVRAWAEDVERLLYKVN